MKKNNKLEERLKKFRKVSTALICISTILSITTPTVYAATDTMDCEDLGDLKRDLDNFFNFFKAIIPLLVIGLSTYDFIKAITAKDDKDIKKSFTKLMKRFIYAIILFFLPILIELLLGLIIENADVCIGK